MNAVDCVRNPVFVELMEEAREPTEADTAATAAIVAFVTTPIDVENPDDVHCACAAEAVNTINATERAKLRATIGRQASTIVRNMASPPAGITPLWMVSQWPVLREVCCRQSCVFR